MNDTDLETRLRALPPDLPDPHDRFGQVEERVRRRRARQRTRTVAAVVVVLAAAVPAALLTEDDGRDIDSGAVIATDPQKPSQGAAPTDHLPGADVNVPLSTPLITEGTGTTTIELGPRPDGATGVSTDLRCLSAGTFTWPSGASLTCTAEDAARAPDAPPSPGDVMGLRPGQTRIVIEADAGASSWISTTYVRTEHTEWGVTANGETYGVPNDAGQPDLIATYAGEGMEVRYARSEDLNGGAPANPDEAMEWMRNGHATAVPTYAEDGLTIVGTYEQSGAASQEPATRVVVGSAPAGAEASVASGVLTLTDDGCLHLDTELGARWLILPWGVQLDGGALERFTGERVAELDAEVTFSGSQVAGQQVEDECGTGLAPFYVTAPGDVGVRR